MCRPHYTQQRVFCNVCIVYDFRPIAMNQFEEQLLRLKLCLGVARDAEVAATLGMSRAAFSNRKQAGSFPDEQLVMLKKTRPELDVMFVLTGERWSAGERVVMDTMAHSAADRSDSDQAKSVARAMRNHDQVLKDAARDPQVRELLGILICCDRAAIERVVGLAARLMGRKPIPFAKRESATGWLMSAERQAIRVEESAANTNARRSRLVAPSGPGAGKIESAVCVSDALPTDGKVVVSAVPAAKAARKSARKTITR